jgi:hypothetical protein
MKLFMIFIFFLACLFINYRLSYNFYESFEGTNRSKSEVGIFFTLMFYFMLIILFLAGGNIFWPLLSWNLYGQYQY